MSVPGSVTVFDVVVLLLVLHGVAVVAVPAYYAEGRSKATSLWRYGDPRVFAVLVVAVALAWWAVVAVGVREGLAAYVVALEEGPTLSLVVGVVLLSYGVSHALLLAHTLAARRRSGPPAAGETVAVSGAAEPVGDTVEAPFSGAEALCSRATVAANEPSGRTTVWAEHGEDVRCRRFAVDGRHGRVHVDPGEAQWRLPETYRRTADADEPVPEHAAEGMDASSDLDVPTSPTVGFSVERYRFAERALEPGRQVVVVGEVSAGEGPPVVDGGHPFVVSQGDPGVVHASVVAGSVLGCSVGGWLVIGGFAALARLVGIT